MATRTALILGGGIGGITTARRLRKLLDADDRIVIVERDAQFRFAPSFLWVLNGQRQPAQITRDLRRLRTRGIEIVEDEVQAIDASARTVTLTSGTLEADAVVVALGAQLAPDAVPGFATDAHVFYTLPGAQSAADAIASITSGRVAVLVAGMPYKCPAAPYEAAFLTDAVLRKRGVRDRIHIDIYTPEALPMPTAGPALGEALRAMLTQRDIGFHPGLSIDHVDPETHRLHFADEPAVGYDILLGVPPHRPPPAVATSAIAGASGYATVDAHTLATSTAGVYAIGDATAIPIAGGKFLPKAGVFAEAEAETVARRIAADWCATKPPEPFDGSGSCFVELGNGRAAYATGDFYEPEGPSVTMRRPGRHWHLAKVAFEQYWIRDRRSRRHPSFLRFLFRRSSTTSTASTTSGAVTRTGHGNRLLLQPNHVYLPAQ